jgi:serine/threonine-protein phosphatase PGAM5
MIFFFRSSWNPSVYWDSNWDHREATSIVPPTKPDSAPEKVNEYKRKLEEHRSKATRHLILIRHGQYNLDGATDLERTLTKLGRSQATKTGERLRDLKIPIDNVVVSTMTRAQETANLILEQIPQKDIIKVTNDGLIAEGAPIEPVPAVEHWNPLPQDFFIEGGRIEAGFRSHVHRADPKQDKDSYSVLVCHGNVIRYIVCRALQFPPEAWLRFNLHHASITWLVIYPNGRVVLRLFGDCGHMPKNHVTLS